MTDATSVPQVAPGLRATVHQLVRTTGRSWAVLAVAALVVALLARPAAERLVDLALTRAGGMAATPAGLVDLLGDPVAAVEMLSAAVITLVVTLAWTVVPLVVADVHLGDATRPRHTFAVVLRRFGAASRALFRVDALLVGLQLTVLQPLGGLTVFAPLSDQLAVPPFIGREFLKAPLSTAVWCALIGAIVFVTCRLVLAPAWTVVTGQRPLRGLLASAMATQRGGLALAARLAVLLVAGRIVGEAVIRLSGALIDLVPSGSARAALAALPVLGLGAVTVLTAQAVALLLVGAVRVATGRSVSTAAAPPRADAVLRYPFPVRLATGVVVVTVVVSTLLVPSRAVSQPAGSAAAPIALVIGHRGHDRGGPENTVAGLEAAAALHPDRVEVDVQQTRDGTFVTSHDSNLLVLAGRDEDIDAMSTAAVTSTTVHEHGHSDTIPTMTAYVRRAGELHMPLLIELKVTGSTDEHSVHDLFTQLDRVRDRPDIWFHSLDETVVRQMTALHPAARVGLTVGPHAGPLPDLPVAFYTVEQGSVTPEGIRQAHRAGREVYAWTVNGDLGMRTLFREGLDGVVTDRPVAARSLAAEVAREAPASASALRDRLTSCCLVP